MYIYSYLRIDMRARKTKCKYLDGCWYNVMKTNSLTKGYYERLVLCNCH